MPDRLSLKWIHGNTNAAVPTVPPGATYDVDDPTMWPPLSVLSGLASGFCERRAVLNPGFVTATGTTTTWVQEGDAGEADRNTIVTNFMNNLAAGTTNYANMFYAKDATMSGMSAGAANYMNSFDSALCRLICSAGNSPETYKADINGTTYGTTDTTAFNTLAAAAYNTASAAAQTDATSAITTPVKNGGTTLKRQFGIALPVEWAKERKWMLDELKFTEGAVVPVTASTITYSVRERYPAGVATEKFNAGVSGASITAAVGSAYKAAVELGTLDSLSLVAGYYSQNYQGPRLTYSAYVDDWRIKSPDDIGAMDIPYALGFSQEQVTLTTNDKIVAYCGEHNYAAENYTVWDEAGAVKITGVSTYPATTNGVYVLVDGATAALTGTNVITSAVSVSSGCIVNIPNGVTVTHLNLMDGARVLPYNATDGGVYSITAPYWYVNYRDTGGSYLLSPCIYTKTTATGVADSSYLVDGGTLTIPDNAQVLNVVLEGTTVSPSVAALIAGTTGNNIQATIVVGAYSLLQASEANNNTNINIGRIVVLSGGTAQLTNIGARYVNVHSGGVLNMDNCYVGRLGVLDGSTVNITGDSYVDGGLTKITDIAVGTFQPFIVGATPGWNTFPVIAASPGPGETAYVTTVDGSTATREAIQQEVADHLPVVAGNILGEPAAEVLPKLRGVRVWQNFGILAVNGGTASSIKNYYTTFKVRQFDPPA